MKRVLVTKIKKECPLLNKTHSKLFLTICLFKNFPEFPTSKQTIIRSDKKSLRDINETIDLLETIDLI